MTAWYRNLRRILSVWEGGFFGRSLVRGVNVLGSLTAVTPLKSQNSQGCSCCPVFGSVHVNLAVRRYSSSLYRMQKSLS